MPLTSGEAISAVLRYYTGAGGTSAGAQWATDAELRAKAEFYLNEVAAECWTWAPWWWKQVDSTVSVAAADGFGYVPAGFSSFGNQGQAYISGQKAPMSYMQPDVLFARLRDGTTTSIPSSYTLHTKTADSGTPVLYLYPAPSSNVTVLLFNFVRTTPVMLDYPVSVVAAAGGAGNVDVGAHTWRVTFDDADDLGSEGGTISSPLTIITSAKVVNLTGVPVSTARTVTKRRIWRTAAGGTQHKLVGSIADNVTTTFSDDVADASLGANVTTPAASVTGMEQYPSDFHHTVLFEGLKAKWMGATGDSRESDFWQRWYQNVKRMWGDQQQGQNALKTMPPYGAGQSWGSRSVRSRFS